MKEEEHEVYGGDILVEGDMEGGMEGHGPDVDMSAADDDAVKELDEIKKRLKEMEEEAAALQEMQAKVEKEMGAVQALSHWCIFHRSKAEVVVATRNEQFRKSQMVQKVPLLYLANDILQNSKHKGTEFVIKFCKVLPAALKDLNENGDDQGKKVVSRLDLKCLVLSLISLHFKIKLI